MAEFPPNLDDGELYLPSDIFLTEVPSKYNPYRLSCMEDLATHFASLSLLKNQPSSTPSRPPPKPPLNYQVKMAVRDLSANHLPAGHVGFNGGGGVAGVEIGQRLYGYGNGSFLARSEPFYEFQVQPQVDSYLDTRPMLLQRPRTPIQNRVYPFRGSGFEFGGGGGRRGRESGGTGVFHPRIVHNSTNDSPFNADYKRKQGVRNKQEIQVNSQQRNSMRRVSKEEDCYYHLPPEMGLPQDWTY
ncbi:uncharacterized protein LOC105635822 isoform X2 [Jatropha curcas]|uniref:uncharacterized protein LOC105635822 isoform X2 n=1 Tax=Jatropha curcas TaxID=180498 RepID=UPI0005FB1ACF|nr:uncharacterized protein LOC105635822 isoform X2 [Jatropha curcas]